MIGLELLFSEASKHLLKIGFQKFSTSKDTEILRTVLAERLLRELKFNLEIYKEFEDENANFIQEIDSRVVETIFSQTIPIYVLFSAPIPDDIRNKIFGENQNYFNWITSIKTESDLIERIWQRTSVAKFRQKNKLPIGEIQYLRKLMICLNETLSIRLNKIKELSYVH